MPLRPILSVIIPVFNDEDQCNATLISLQKYTPPGICIEVIVVDDFSDAAYIPTGPVGQPSVYRLRRNEGPAMARHYGMTVAHGEYCLHIDSHMLFHYGWVDAWIDYIPHDNFLLCGTYVTKSRLDYQDLSIGGGANLSFFDFKDNKPRILEVDPMIEGVYGPDLGAGGSTSYEVPCSVGACYFFHRETYFRYKGLVGLTGWGCEEQMMSLKYWLSGGSVRVMPDVRIGHIGDGLTNVNRIDPWRILYNKILVIWHILGKDMAWYYLSFVRHPYTDKVKDELEIRSDENDRMYNTLVKECFVHDIDWYCSKFNIANPADLKGAMLSA